MIITGKYASADIKIDSLDENVIEQITNILNNSVSENSNIVIMPDAHLGAGICIGYTQKFHNNKSIRISPNFIGVDIGCSVSAYNIGNDFDIDNIDNLKLFDNYCKNNVPHGTGNYYNGNSMVVSELRDKLLSSDIFINGYNELKKVSDCTDIGNSVRQICSLGDGNHFIALNKHPNGDVYITVHTGSRYYGKHICDIYQKIAKENCPNNSGISYLDDNCSDELNGYISCMNSAMELASYNHRAIHSLILDEFFHKPFDESNYIHTRHNYIDNESSELTIRKGAISARLGEKLLIPLNMRDGIILGTGKGNSNWNYSAPHGAGRLFSRTMARKMANKEDIIQEMIDYGVYSTSVENALDEAAFAYKSKDIILNAIGESVEVNAILKEVYNMKG